MLDNGPQADCSVEIDIGDGVKTIIDASDYAKVSSEKWFCDESYVMDSRTGRIRLHRFIMEPSEGNVVHHINGNRLDNRRCNLRELNQRQHMLIHRSKKGFYGIHAENIRKQKYKVEILYNEHTFNLGRFFWLHEAQLVYDWAARILFGLDATLNLPDVLTTEGAYYILRSSGGQIMSVTFKKRSNGQIRTMQCQIVGPTGKRDELFYGRNSLVLVKTMNQTGYRTIPVENVTELVADRIKYRVLREIKENDNLRDDEETNKRRRQYISN